MIAVVQRVKRASVRVEERIVGEIGKGILVLAAIRKDDTPQTLAWTAGKIAGMRLFPSEKGAFDLDVREAGGEILLVSNFTVAALTASGRRPSLSPAMAPVDAAPMFDQFVELVRSQQVNVAIGAFGASMQVELINDGPITFVVDSDDW